ncbi:SH3 domain-containing protein [Mesorhizobium mediterraneum]|uniref:SH3 domain-containing protein n=1 Tax=Mesorhizobium mediterraneum TaxID=43617 RepID=UPI00177B263B|nr:SH3 domain-containing protein [Mesorhizobium mediterraneum]
MIAALLPFHGVLAQERLGQPIMPVTVPPTDGIAANCLGGVVTGLKPGGDGFLAVRAGPGTNHRMLDRLHSGNDVRICDRRGDWLGIVYGKGYCNDVDRASERARSYAGPCRSGWVHGRWIEVAEAG